MISFYKRKTEEPIQSIPNTQMQSVPNKTQTYSTYTPIQSKPAATPQATPRPTPQPTPRQITPAVDYSKYISKPGVPNQFTAPTTPAPTPAPQAKSPTSGYEDLITRYRKIAEERAAREAERAAQTEERLTANNAANQEMLNKQLTNLSGLKDKSISRIQETIPEQERATEEYKAKVADIYGQQDKEAILAEQENQARLQNTFAGLNTQDSSVFQQQVAKSGQNLTSALRTSGQAKAAEIAQADRELKDFKSQAQSLIEKEIVNFDSAIQQIQNTMIQGTQEFNDAVADAYNKANDNIYGIETEVTKAEMGFQEKMAEIQNKAQTAGKLTDKQALAKTGFDSIKQLDNYIISNPSIMRDINPFSNRDYKTLITNVTDLIGRMRSGGAISKPEEDRFKTLLPSFWDSPENAQFKLQQLGTEFANILQQPDYTQMQNQSRVITAPDGQQIILVD